MKTEYDDWN